MNYPFDDEGVAMFYLMWILVSFLILIPLYLLPTILALKNNHPNKVPIIVINILCGWSAIGWIVALVWCFIEPENRNLVDVTQEIERLHELKEKGV